MSDILMAKDLQGICKHRTYLKYEELKYLTDIIEKETNADIKCKNRKGEVIGIIRDVVEDAKVFVVFGDEWINCSITFLPWIHHIDIWFEYEQKKFEPSYGCTRAAERLDFRKDHPYYNEWEKIKRI